MGNKRQRKNATRKKLQQRKRKPGRRRNRPSLGRLIASGVKTLLASVPGAGSTLSQFADFAFKALGLSAEKSLTNSITALKDVDTSITVLVARFHIKVSSLIVGSRDVIQSDMDRSVLCQYSDGRVVNLSVTAIPTNEASKRQGFWTMSLQPFSTPADAASKGFTEAWCPTDQGMKHALLSTTGSALRNLSLSYTPKMSDGYAYTFQQLDSSYAEVAIRYADYNRDTYSSFKTSDFNCQVIVSGRVELRVSPTMPPSDTGGFKYNTTVDDKLKSLAMFVSFHDDTLNKTRTLAIKSDGFSCQDSDKSCKITGVIQSFNDPLDPDEEFEEVNMDC